MSPYENETGSAKVILINSPSLSTALSLLSDYELSLSAADNFLVIKALDYGRTILIVHRIKYPSMPSRLRNRAIKIYDYINHGDGRITISEYSFVEELNEPDVYLNTVMIADVTALSKYIRRYEWRDYTNVSIGPGPGYKVCLRFISDTDMDVIPDPTVARILKGSDHSIYKIRLLNRGFTFMRNMKIRRVRILYSAHSPMLIKPLIREYPRVWIAPTIIEY